MKISRIRPYVIIVLIMVLITSIVVANFEKVSNVKGSTSVDKIATMSTGLFNKISLDETDPVSLTENVQTGLTIPDDPLYSKQWSLHQMNIQRLWNISKGNEGTLIAILDTGIDKYHEDLKDKVVAEVNFTGSSSVNDLNGHGTHVAGIISASIDNGIGIAGLSPATKVMSIKVADDYGFCQAETVAHGIIWAVDNGAKIINISLEIKNPCPDLEQAVNYAWNHGALIVAAAGNQGNDLPVYPAYYENCIAVAATQPDNALDPLSNYGDWVDMKAPGLNIFSTLPCNKYGYKSGTSFATAYVTGLAANLISMVSDINSDGKLNDELRNAVQYNYYGFDYSS